MLWSLSCAGLEKIRKIRFSCESQASVSALAGIGVRGILRLGVDGDVAGLLSLSEEFEEVFLTKFRPPDLAR